ncbi:hypothetical protein [Streptomyces sp. CBMA156]|uniref:hypothetical protein n=1 Tax=Streptomyces sp. CBMA156 TaxID=1930280 RepID=UPI00166210F2|nr:hypothetical protein [Streptomyces sp. CBMA156]
MMHAADRLTGRDALRDRALIYLLLNSYFGHEKLRPGTILALDLEDRVNEGFRTSWKVQPKNAENTALTTVTVNRDAARALDAYVGWTVAGTYEPDPLTGRVISPAHGTYLSRGALLTGSSNRARGARLARSDTINRIVRAVVVALFTTREVRCSRVWEALADRTTRCSRERESPAGARQRRGGGCHIRPWPALLSCAPSGR